MYVETALHPPQIARTNNASKRNKGPILEPMLGLGGVNTRTRQRIRALAASTLAHHFDRRKSIDHQVYRLRAMPHHLPQQTDE